MADPKVVRTELNPQNLWEPVRLPDSNLRNLVEVRQEIVPIVLMLEKKNHSAGKISS